MKFDKDQIKKELTLEQVSDLVAYLGGDPQQVNDHLICATICHNLPGDGSHKLYYYDNTKLFQCYTECSSTFDIYDLVRKSKNMAGLAWQLPQAIEFVASYFGYEAQIEDFEFGGSIVPDRKIIQDLREKLKKKDKQKVDLKVYDGKVIQYLPHPHFVDWEKEGIEKSVCEARGLCYDAKSHGIVIPHYDMDGNLVGIRERTLVRENEKYGKYRPALLQGQMYNHPLGFNLYNLNFSKDMIKMMGVAIVFEGEKSCLKYASIFGLESDITVACCGSNLTKYQFDLLREAGAREIVIAFDKQYQKADYTDKEFLGWMRKLKAIDTKYKKMAQITFMLDTDKKLGYKDSPIDCGKDTFADLFKDRIDGNEIKVYKMAG